MADEAFRSAERRARESGEVADAARLLLEQVRRGELQAGALSLAAYLGDPAAGAALGARLEVDEADEVATTRWARGLVAWGWPIFGRALFASVMAELEATPGLDPTGEVLAALEAYWDEQTESRRWEFQVGGDGLQQRRIVKSAAVAAYHWGATPPRPQSRDLPPLLVVPMTPDRLRPRLRRWAFESGEALKGPAGTDLVREAIESGTPRARLELADQLRASIGQEVQVIRSSRRAHRLVPRVVNDEQVRGDVPGEGERFVRLKSITAIQVPGRPS